MGARLLHLDGEIAELAPKIEHALSAASQTGAPELLIEHYRDLVEQQKKLSERAGTLEAQLSAGWSCADALVRPPACAPACPCAHLPLRPPAQPCVTAL